VEFTVTVTVNGQVILSTTQTLADVDDSFETDFQVATAS
jgi:hypothetical protein